MLVGGALAGLGGFAQLAGVEFKLRPGFLLDYGYIGFLASWLARHEPVRVAVARHRRSPRSPSAATASRLDSGLPAASVNILMALVLLGRLRLGRQAEGGQRERLANNSTQISTVKRGPSGPERSDESGEVA